MKSGLEKLGVDITSVFKYIPFVGDGDGMLSEEELYTNATIPRRIVANGGGAREVYDLGSEEYEVSCNYVNDIIETFKNSNVSVQKITYDDWKNLFKGEILVC